MGTKTDNRKMVANEHGLIVTDQTIVPMACAGYLFFHDGQAFDPDGLIEGVKTKDEVDAHNKILSQMEIEGLDNNCKVGQGGMFYFSRTNSNADKVCTWIGTVVGLPSSIVPYRGGFKVKFTRKGKTLEGVVKKGECCGFFKCIKISES